MLIQNKIISYYRNNRHKLLKSKILLKVFDFIYEKLFPFEKIIKKRFYKVFQKKLNLKDPTTFNEKIQWLKLNDRTILHTLCADKIAVRDYIKKQIGEKYLIPQYFSTENLSDISKEKITYTPVIIKANHNSGSYHIIKNLNDVNWSEIRKKLDESLKINYYYHWREWQYKNISPKILVEELLIDEKGNVPFDYKFHCINGKVSFIQVDIDRQTKHKRNLYDINWNLLEITYNYPNSSPTLPPKNLIKMIQLAEKLSKPFSYVRVDFYDFNDKIYFGEITFHPEAGFGIFKPSKWDLNFGKKIKLHTTKVPKFLIK